ncbi:aspartate, glycine, lysine and serine-rich-like protein [Cinnamomum micranthum f. kanehirae]|uniref:Aspartate, glycine, lysine and serine-rich-like protein n=1 Tax=Cinnamomum micranthum f. kanehirae TaxID=337451 RepID=A0A3S3QLP6_9MAGN|nr:aspartate, glycine, lysine and serine-rich-like protein [Cinnamomum micranthum f. kanehirae]
MARQENSFALLIDDESDDMSALIAAVAAKAPPPTEKKQQPQKNQQTTSPAKLPSKPLPPAESVRTERGRGRGRGGRGRGGLGRLGSGDNDAGQFGNGRTNGYQRNLSGDSDGNFADDGFRVPGRGPRGRGRGRGRGSFNEDRGYGNENQAYGGSESQEQGGGGWEEGTENSGKGNGNENHYFRNENRQFGNENQTSGSEGRGYGGENRGFRGGKGRQYGGPDGIRYRRGEGEGHNEFEKKEDSPGWKEPENSDTQNGRDVPETTEMPKDAEPEQGKPEHAVSEDVSEKKVPEEDKEMTLDEYEKLLSEKRKALEVLKSEERKVALDKDFEAMQLIDKKKEDANHHLFIKLKSEKDKLKKKVSFEKEERARKSVSINEFLKPAEGDKYGGRGGRGGGRGRGRGGGGGGFRGGFSGRSGNDTGYAASAPCIEDPGQFPLLGGAAVTA